ncbi:MAG: alpha/beta hydrolase [Gemmatimonadetes bacterium]|nr:alpha/beta hydrolase [Gemmatimonadota bacterium]
MNSPETVIIPTSDEPPVVADLYAPETRSAAGIVVLCHGFTGHRRWGFIPWLADRLASGGIEAMSIDFSHNGRVTAQGQPSEDGFPAPELFLRNTLRRECDDLGAVLDWIAVERPGAPVGLWGHSRGAAAAILQALSGREIAAIATWAAAAVADRHTERQKKEWRHSGVLEFNDSGSGVLLKMGVEYLDDIRDRASEYDFPVRASELTVPHLIIHGEHDPAIPIDEAISLYQTAQLRADKKLLRMLTGHTFGYEAGREPGEPLRQSGDATTEWFAHYFSGESTG